TASSAIYTLSLHDALPICCARGGAPRNNRKAADGELYILDLGPAFRGYFSDNCRTFAVNRKPTDEQQTAWTFVMKVFKHLEATRSEEHTSELQSLAYLVCR